MNTLLKTQGWVGAGQLLSNHVAVETDRPNYKDGSHLTCGACAATDKPLSVQCDNDMTNTQHPHIL